MFCFGFVLQNNLYSFFLIVLKPPVKHLKKLDWNETKASEIKTDYKITIPGLG